LIVKLLYLCGCVKNALNKANALSLKRQVDHLQAEIQDVKLEEDMPSYEHHPCFL